MKERMLAVESLKVSKGSQVLLQDVSFELLESQVLCVVGPKNSGQNILLRALMGDLQCHKIEGRLEVEKQSKFGYVSESLHCISELSVFQNLSLILNFIGIQSQTHLAEAVESSLRSVHLWSEIKPRLHDQVSSLTDFEKMRLNLARTLILRPRILLLDNPTVVLDPIERSHYEKIIDSLKTQMAIIWMTNDLEQAGRMADSILFVKDGIAIEFGSTEDIFTTPRRSETENFLSRRFYV